MTIWAVGSLRGAPGATALAMGLGAAWPATTGRPRVVIEADPDGGVLAARFEELRADKTIADAAVALRRDLDVARLLEASRPVWGGLPVVPAHPSAEQTSSVLVNAGERLAVGLASAADLDAIVDVGRITARSAALPLARRAVATLLVSRTRFEDVASLSARTRELRSVGVDPCLVAVGSRPYDPRVQPEVGTPQRAGRARLRECASQTRAVLERPEGVVEVSAGRGTDERLADPGPQPVGGYSDQPACARRGGRALDERECSDLSVTGEEPHARRVDRGPDGVLVEHGLGA